MPKKGKRVFKASELLKLRSLIVAKQGRPKTEQKALRDQLRELGFYISDFGNFDSGITAADFDALVAAGDIEQG